MLNVLEKFAIALIITIGCFILAGISGGMVIGFVHVMTVIWGFSELTTILIGLFLTLFTMIFVQVAAND